MPIVGENYQAQQQAAFAQTQQQAAQFALALRNLGLAERQFKAEREMADRNFALRQEQWDAERGLMKLKLDAAEFQLQQAQGQAERAQALPGALDKVLKPYGELTSALIGGDPEEVRAAQEKFHAALGQEGVAPYLDILGPSLRHLSGVDSNVLNALITRGTTLQAAQLRAAGGAAAPEVDYAENAATRIRDYVTDSVLEQRLGVKPADLAKSQAAERARITPQIQATASRFNQALRVAQQFGTPETARDIIEIEQGRPTADVVARVIASLQKARDKAPAPQEVNDAIKALEQSQRLLSGLQVKQQSEAEKLEIGRKLAGRLTSQFMRQQPGLPSEKALGGYQELARQTLEPAVNAGMDALEAIQDTPEWRQYLSAKGPEAVSAASNLVRNRLGAFAQGLGADYNTTTALYETLNKHLFDRAVMQQTVETQLQPEPTPEPTPQPTNASDAAFFNQR